MASGAHSLSYPAGSNNPVIRRSILPNKRFVRRPYINNSQEFQIFCVKRAITFPDGHTRSPLPLDRHR